MKKGRKELRFLEMKPELALACLNQAGSYTSGVKTFRNRIHTGISAGTFRWMVEQALAKDEPEDVKLIGHQKLLWQKVKTRRRRKHRDFYRCKVCNELFEWKTPGLGLRPVVCDEHRKQYVNEQKRYRKKHPLGTGKIKHVAGLCVVCDKMVEWVHRGPGSPRTPMCPEHYQSETQRKKILARIRARAP